MPKLNPNILLDPLGGLNAQFGVPLCMIGLAKHLLALLPGGILTGLYEGIEQGIAAARSVISSVTRAIFRDLGIIEYDTATGRFVFISDSSKWGIDGYGSGLFGEIGNFLGLVAGFGAELWRNYQVIDEWVKDIEDCIGEFKTWLGGVENKSNIKSEQELAVTPQRLHIAKSQIKTATDFIDKCEATLRIIEEIFDEREKNPDLIPKFTDDDGEVDDPLFRLTFGPPKAKSGQFILSVDGLYYDSQTREYGSSGSPTDVPTITDISALEFVPDENRWLLDHSPNLGGRGGSYTIDDLDRYVDTIFDLRIIDETKDLIEYYDADHLVQFLTSQKNKRIEDIKDNLVDLRASGYSTDSAIYLNFDQQIITESASFNNKINKRKKQIEVAVKTPDLFGVSSMFAKGGIPINDFSYLSSINLDVEISKQKGLVFDHGEVSGAVLPLLPKYVHAPESRQKVVITPLQVTPPGAGSIIDGEELETEAPLLSLITGITTSELVAVYNFTDVNIKTPASTEFNTLNCNALGTENRAQTVTTKPSQLFQQGLGVPYLTGITQRYKADVYTNFTGETWSDEEFYIQDAGNYIRLPDTSDYQNLLYSPSGATIEFWTHMPGLHQQEDGWWKHPYETSAFNFSLSSSSGKWCDGHYYRVLLGCENTGGENTGLDQSEVSIDNSSDSVKGMLMGFSRDPRMYFEGSAVSPGGTDFSPRDNFGAILEGVDNALASDGHPYTNGDSGIWTLSSVPTNALPKAFVQASGTFGVSSVNSVTDTMVFTVTSTGDGYTASSNDACSVLYTSSVGGTVSTVSALLDVPYFATGTNKTLNIGTPSTVFFVAPTRSYNTSSVGFTKSLDCNKDVGEILRFVVSDQLEVNGVKLADCINKFVLVSLVFDVSEDKLKFFVNGTLLKEQGLSTTFGRSRGSAPQVPSFVVPRSQATSSFEYASGTVSQSPEVSLFDAGPKNNKYFTPWIVGGGWTDGRDINLATSSGGFLDTGAGIMSSYNGYVGSLKIYKKALNTKEIVVNYNHQKKFFENIDL